MSETSSSIVERIRALEGAGITDVFVKKRVPSYAMQAAAIGDSIQSNYSDSLLGGTTRPKTTKIYQNPANYAPSHHSVSSLNSSLSSPPNRLSEPEIDHHHHHHHQHEQPISHFTNIIPDIYEHRASIEQQRTSSRNELNNSLNRAPSIDSIENEIRSQEVDYRVTNLVSSLTDAKKNLRRVSANREQFDYNLLQNSDAASSSPVNQEEICLQVPIAPESRNRSASASSNNSVFKYAKNDSITIEPRLAHLASDSAENISNLNMFNPSVSKRSSINSVVKSQIDHESIKSAAHTFKQDQSTKNSSTSSYKLIDHNPVNLSMNNEWRKNSNSSRPKQDNETNLSINEWRKNSSSSGPRQDNEANLSMHEWRKSSSSSGPRQDNDANLSIHESSKSSISAHMYEVNRSSGDGNVSVHEWRKSSTSTTKSREASVANEANTWINKESRKSSASTLKAELSPSNSLSSGLNNSNKESSNSNNNSFNQSNKRLLIYNDQATKAMSQTIHPEHFACWNCDTSLTGSRYILKDDHPYCIRCYEDMFANECEECRKKIGTDSKDLSYKDKHWHEKCFFCHVCKLPLVDKPFGNKNDSLYCSECYNQAFASRCDKCAQIFKPGMKKMEYKGQQFHETCFLCYSCDTAIGTKSFIPKENRIYCVPCYENNFATKCTECMKVISQGGVSYKNQPYHKECFVCTHCQQSLAGQRFTSREDHPYCSDCFGKLFAKKCFACHKPITGIGGTKYISFEDRHWHNDCFMCNRCNSSLVGRGFLTDAMDILCPDCGKNEP